MQWLMAQIWTRKGSYTFFRVKFSADFSNYTQKNENHICVLPPKLLFAGMDVNLCIQGGIANTMIHTGFSDTGICRWKIISTDFLAVVDWKFCWTFVPGKFYVSLVLCDKS